MSPLIHLLTACDQRCVFCSYPAERPVPEGGGLPSWVSALKTPGLVQVSGGEPLLADGDALLRFVLYCAGRRRRVELQTNGVLLARLPETYFRRLVRAVGLSGGYFNVNFPSDSAAADLKITRTRGAFAARARGVRRLIKAGAAVRLTHVISSLNYRRLPAFVKFASARLKGVSWIQFSFIKAYGRSERGGFVPRYAEVSPYLIKALGLCRERGLACETDHIPPCFLGEFALSSVDAKKLSYGEKGRTMSEKAYVAACRGCRLRNICPGPRKDYIKVHRTL
ncbi:MAG: radical SAM domain-containing protein [Elusimicrobia bacterium]|nr:MAG: radical SAM domain-containing protein [Elusimicrobiota bacterium]KAF0155355.1 MAG: radical SAM domain-containing protein [Elusimicrobiota bacterium]